MKLSTACVQCRDGKRKCSKSALREPCTSCIRRNLPCSKSATPSRRSREGCSAYEATYNAIQPPYTEEIIHLVDLYFDFINDKPHALFHEPSFKASVRDGTVSRTVLLSLIGLSARFADKQETRALGPIYSKAAKEAFKANLEHVCIENIQACVVIANIYLAESDPKAESLYYALAIRTALFLDLPSALEAESGVAREIKRRVWWTCILVDVWSSGGSGLPRQLYVVDRPPRLPLEESMFFALKPGDQDVEDALWRPGMWSRMVGMVEIYKEIQDLNRYLVVVTEWDEQFIENTVQDLAIRLLNFEETFEPELCFSAQNLRTYTSRGLGRLYAGFHLGYQYYCMLLFYQYLDKNRPFTTNGSTYAKRCKSHAQKFCDILRLSREDPKSEALHNIIAHVTVVSSSVLLHTYVFGDASELEATKCGLESNMEALVRLQEYWPSVELMINKLVVFLKNCVNSTTVNSHRFDRWMVKFLQEYGMPLDEKDEFEDPTAFIREIQDSGLGQRSRTIQNVMSTYWSETLQAD